MVGYFINYSTGQTNKVSFKAAGFKYREQYTIEKITNLPDMPIEEAKVKVKQSFTVKNTESDLQVLSSFDCVKAIPTVLIDYISNTFVNEYGRSHRDFHSEHRIDETLPLLEKYNLNCDINQNCDDLGYV